MFPSDEFWKGVLFSAVIGGTITVLMLKLFERKETALKKTGAEHKSNKQPVEHDEQQR